MRNIFFIGTFLTISGLLYGQQLPDWKSKVSPGLLEQTKREELVPYLVLLHQQADIDDARMLHTKEAKGQFVYQQLSTVAASSQADIMAILDARQIPYQSLFIINAIRVKGDLCLIAKLARRDDVARIVADPVISFPPTEEWQTDAPSGRSAIEWGIERINADDVWNLGFRGQGVVVGGEDTGYEWSHPALKQRYRGYNAELDTVDHNYSWHDAIHEPNPFHGDSLNPCGFDVKEPCDDRGHGTHTMGTMIGLDGENQIGVAPDAEWCACRNMERGWGTPFTYLECFEWFLAPTDLNGENPNPALAPHVINNSWGCPEVEGCDSTNWHIMDMAVNNLRAAGVVVVVSAGNDGPDCGTVSSPAAMYEGSFSVGATAPNDTIANFSSRGPVFVDHSQRLKPNVSAPGVWVRSSTRGGEYGFSSGTSMAGPHVAGLVALIISANPELAGQVELIEDIIESTAVPKTTDQQCGDVAGTEVPNPVYGYGRIDALAAVEAALALIETSTEDQDQMTSIQTFPNPVSTNWFVMNNTPVQPTRVTISDMHGRVWINELLAKDEFSHEFKMTHMPAGLYFYSVECGQVMTSGKVVKAE